MKNLLQIKVTRDLESSRQALEHELRSLKQKVETAQQALAKGEAIDENIIQNASGLTRAIVHYNVATDLLPYLEDNGT